MRVEVRSAGSTPAREIHREVIKAMEEVGIDLSREFPKPLTDEAVRASDVVETMSCGDACTWASVTRIGISPTREPSPLKRCDPSASRSTAGSRS